MPVERLTLTLAMLLASAAPVAGQIVFGAPVHDSVVPGGIGNLVGQVGVGAIGDVDGDGDLDLVVGGSTNGPHGALNFFDILTNDGQADFTLVSNADRVFTADAVVETLLVDLNGDAALDLVIAGFSLRVRMGAGDGTFSPATTVHTTVDENILNVAALDLTGDGLVDLVSMNGKASFGDIERIDLLPGLGDGTFAPAILVDLVAADLDPQDAHAGDLNGDGITDLVVSADNSAGTSAIVYLGLGGGSFGPAASYGFSAKAGGQLKLADVSGDGQLDLVLGAEVGVGYLPGLGDGSFGAAVLLDLTDLGVIPSLLVDDFDGDGLLDVVAFSSLTREIIGLRGAGAGSFLTDLRHTAAFHSHFWPLLAADFDQDGLIDLLRASEDGSNYHLTLFMNHTYASGSAFADQGFALAGTHAAGLGVPAAPILVADGTLLAGDDVQVTLARNGVTPSSAWLVLGFSELLAPFKGGTLVPSVDVLLGPLPFPSADDTVVLSSPMPAGVPSGVSFWMQAWFAPGASPQDIAASSAVRATTP